MSDLEFNKIAAGVLVAGLVAMVSGKVADALYHPVVEPEKRGYQIEVAEAADTPGGAPAADAAPVDILPLLAQADAAAGEAMIKKCASCHDFSKGGANKVGPGLWGIIGHDKAAHEGFTYSDALKSLGGKWDYQSLSEFLTKPAAYAKGTKMSFAGIKKPEERAQLIAYLRSLSDSPLPLPDIKAAPAAEATETAPAKEEKH